MTTASSDPREVNFGPPADPPEVSTADFDPPLLQAEEGERVDLSGLAASPAKTRGAVDHNEAAEAIRFFQTRRRPNHAAGLRCVMRLHVRRHARIEGLSRVVRSRGRSRAAGCGAGRSKGSRRGSGSRSGSRGDPGDESEPHERPARPSNLPLAGPA